jgi:hypothetical protein
MPIKVLGPDAIREPSLAPHLRPIAMISFPQLPIASSMFFSAERALRLLAARVDLVGSAFANDLSFYARERRRSSKVVHVQ